VYLNEVDRMLERAREVTRVTSPIILIPISYNLLTLS
jgi:hypothetical protein